MGEPGLPTRDLIETLTRELRPVRPLRGPFVRAATWLAVVVGIGAVLAACADRTALGQRMALAPDMWIAVMGSAATTVAATIAAFQLSLPDRRAMWAWLPLPAALVWMGASGMGCLRTAFVDQDGGYRHSLDCLVFITALSLPLSGFLILMLRRGYALRPGLTALVGGLAAAGAAATLLNFFHPFDAIITDLMVHAMTIALVVGINGAWGGRILRAER